MSKKNLKRPLTLIIFFFVFINIALVIVYFKNRIQKQNLVEDHTINVASYLSSLAEKPNWTFQELSDFFTATSSSQGALFGFEVLRQAKLPPETDIHLLGHVVGDVLYEQQGTSGMSLCTQEFRNACSHSIVVGTLLEKGVGALSEIMEACKKAPGGKGAYTMCFHGLGHGVLAYTDYNLENAVKMCNKIGEQEAQECVGGAIMEIISGGDHDPVKWLEQKQVYLKPKDPFSICLNDYMKENTKPLCIVYLTPYLVESVGGNFGNPTDTDLKKAMNLCERLSSKEKVFYDSCYGGFGKEFVVLAPNRDIRTMSELTLEHFEKIERWCNLADNPEGRIKCTDTAMNSLFWGGENNRDIAVNFCNSLDSKAAQKSCFEGLIVAVGYYITDESYKISFCRQIPAEFDEYCKNKLLSK